MIQVIYDPEGCRLELQGHAGSAPWGQDLICAGVSTLALSLQDYAGSRGGSCFLQAGKGVITCPPAFREGFDAICQGFRVLSRIFPENVTFLKGDREESSDLID